MTTATWMIRGGRNGEREKIALTEGLVVLGWPELGDVSGCSDRLELRQMVAAAYPGEGKATVGNWVGQLWRVLREIQIDDLVVQPLKTTQQLAIGRVTGSYEYREHNEPGFRHVRPVQWLRTDVPRSAVQQDLLDSLGSLLTVCELRRFGAARRVAALATGHDDPGPDGDELPTTGVTTPAELLERAANGSPGKPFTLTIRELLACWRATRRTPEVVADIEGTLANNGLVSVPPFTEGWLDNVVGLVPLANEPGDTAEIVAITPGGKITTAEEPAITSRVGSLEPANKGVAHVLPEDLLTTAATVMLEHNYSQLAVIDDNGSLRGAVSWESIGKARISGRVNQVQDALVFARVVEHSEELLGQIDEIYSKGYIFVRGADQMISGIITAADLTVQFGDLARPFMLIEEAERRLRRRVDEVFTLDEIRHVAPKYLKTIASAAGLTLGSYKHLLKPPAHWKKLGWEIDHEIFSTLLKDVCAIRNELMHFTPDPLTEVQLARIGGFVRILRTVDPRA